MQGEMNMQKIFIRRLTFKSFVKLFILIELSVGLFIGILSFCSASFFGIGSAEINGIQYHGLTAGILNLFIAPVISMILGVLNGIFAYLPFKIVMKVLKKVRLDGEFAREEVLHNEAQNK